MGGPSDSEKQQQRDIATEQVNLAKAQQAQSDKISGIVTPGLSMAENYYTALASGDINKIMAAISPSVNSIATNTESAKQQIKANVPRGGAQDLALAQADIAKGAQVGNLETSAYTSSFPALAALAQGGLGISVNEVANAIASFAGGAQTNQGVMQTEAEGKASTMGFFGSLAQGAGAAAACWVAAELYGGWFSLEAVSIRRWLIGSFYMRPFLWFYLLTGRRWAEWIRKNKNARYWTKKFFDLLLVASR